VEAARAGEQGRGFAVVATEVRNLAQRSAAAKEIKQLIDASVNNVENGTRLVERAGETMEQIVASVQQVTDVMGEISAASHEQSLGIEEVHKAIALMDQVTQQNAALVEQAGAAVASLQDQALHLTQAVGVFQLARRSRLAAARRPRRKCPPRLPRLCSRWSRRLHRAWPMCGSMPMAEDSPFPAQRRTAAPGRTARPAPAGYRRLRRPGQHHAAVPSLLRPAAPMSR
jgi:hypothetical protein